MARNADAHRDPERHVRRLREVAKEYRALVAGTPPGDAGSIDVALEHGRKGRMRPAGHEGESGRLEALTDWRVLARHAPIRRSQSRPRSSLSSPARAASTRFESTPERSAARSSAIDSMLRKSCATSLRA